MSTGEILDEVLDEELDEELYEVLDEEQPGFPLEASRGRDLPIAACAAPVTVRGPPQSPRRTRPP